MQLDEKTKKTLAGIAAVVIVAVAVVWMIANPGPEHIEDTNGPDNYALQQITQEDIVAHTMGARGGLSTGETHLELGVVDISSGTKYSCKKFTGVQMLYSATIFKGSDIHVQLTDYHVNSGNFGFFIVLDGQIVGQATPDEFGTVEFWMEDIEKTGALEYVIAGESADFRFTAIGEW